MLFTNVNLINNAKWAYDMIKNVNPKVEMIVAIDIQMTASHRVRGHRAARQLLARVREPRDHRLLLEPVPPDLEGRHQPVFDTKDDVMILAGVAAKASGELTGDQRFADYWKFALEGRPEVYIQRLLDTSTTTPATSSMTSWPASTASRARP